MHAQKTKDVLLLALYLLSSFTSFFRFLGFRIRMYSYLVHVRSRILFDVFHPVPDVVEGLLVGCIVHQHDTHRPTIVSFRDSPEALLTRSVPYLKLTTLLVYHNLLYLEVDTYG